MGRIALTSAMAALALIWGGTDAARAQATPAAAPVVVELYTSQGCSSCPPADAYLGRIAKRDDVIALSLHVDYWDYLGWRDVFSSPAHTRRQRDYAAVMRERMVYTPQIVVQGREAMVGSHESKVEEAIGRHLKQPNAATIDLSIQGDRIVADVAPADSAGMARGRVLMAWFSHAEKISIKRGENRGRDIVYHNVVRGWSDLGAWRGDRVALTAPKPMGADGIAVLVQDADGGPILGAAKLALR